MRSFFKSCPWSGRHSMTALCMQSIYSSTVSSSLCWISYRVLIVASESRLLPNVFSMCINRSFTEISFPSSSVWAHLLEYPWRPAKMWGCMLVSSYYSRKVSTSKHQSMYITLAPGSVDLKNCISNVTGTSRFFS